MKKAFSSKNNVSGSNHSYASKPAKIGAVIATQMAEQKISKQMVADYMGKTTKTIDNWLKRVYLPIPEMMELSKLFKKDLMALYRPDVKPEPNPLQAELDKQKGYVKSLEGTETKNEKLRTENKSLRDQIELLKELIEKLKGK